MEIVYRTKQGTYPFNRAKETDSTYVQHLVPNSTLPITQQLKQTVRIYKSLQCPHLVPLYKFMKDQTQTHFFYLYYPVNLHGYLSDKSKAVLLRLREQLTCALQCLQNSGLKAEANIQNIAVDSEGGLKLFITPQNLSQGNNLNEFYVTERTRLLMQLSEVWQLYNTKNVEQSTHEHPGFRISGNGLIFTEDDKKNEQHSHPHSEQHSHPPSEQHSHTHSEQHNHPYHEAKGQAKKQSGHVHSAQMILAEIEKQKEKAKKLKEKHNYIKGQGAEHLVQSQAEKTTNLLKKCSTNSESQTMRQSHKSDLNFKTKKLSQAKLTNSAAESPNVSSKKCCNFEDRPCSNARNQKQAESHHCPLSYQDIRAIAIKHLQDEGKEVKQQPRIQVTTEMISKYKMKIVTCQEIEFQGKEGDDIEKIAQQKLLEYQQQYNLSAISIENAAQHSSDQTNTKTSNDKSGSFEEAHDRKERGKFEGGEQEIMAKIMKAKEKAENVLKQYAKTKKK